MYILGINAYHGDAAAALIKDGRLVAAAEEERFNRVKHCAGFPAAALRYCLAEAGITISDVDHIGISRDPSAHLHKKVLFAAKRLSQIAVPASRVEFAQASVHHRDTENTEDAQKRSETAASQSQPNGNGRAPGIFRQIKDRLGNAAKVRDLKDDVAHALGIDKKTIRAQFHNIEHHRAHLASSFYVSPFERAALLSIDGFGDFISTMWARGDGNTIDVLGQVEYPHSTGIVYTATTQFLGFPHYGDEGKVMGLAPYGKPRFMNEFRNIIQTEAGGKF
jgi:carbamoyltransferase